MNMKKRITLYVSLFVASMLISAFAITALADGQQSMEVTYHQLSAAEKNNYTVNIPATLALEDEDTEKSFNISLEDGYFLSDGFAVEVFLDNSCIDSENNTLKLYLNGDTSSYYYAYNLYRGDDSVMVEYENADSNPLLTVTKNGIINNSYNGNCKIVLNEAYTTHTGNMEGGDYSGTMTFNIWCHN